MSKKYYVGHDDGRAIFVHNIYSVFYVKDMKGNYEDTRLFRTSSRKEADRVMKRTLEAHWQGFKVKRLKK